MADKILFRRGPESSIPVLDLGEPGITTDTNKLFVGTGTKNIGIPTSEDLESYVPLSQVGAKNGVATLDQNGKLSSSEKPTYTASEVGARPSTWTPSATDVGAIPASQVGANGGIATLGEDGKLTESQRPVITPEGIGAIPESKIGTPEGVVPLGSNGLIAAQYIPGGLDEIKEYDNREAFPPTGEDNIYYLAKDTNLLYRWGGSSYVEISPSLALGETSETAYRGDRGKTAYDHSQITSGNPHGTTASDVGAQVKLTGTQGQVVGFDSSGNAIAQEAPSGLPEGGTQGQLLAQGANGAEWVDNPVLAFGPQTVATSAWASDSTYSDYPYRASIALSGVTANHVPNVNFNSSDALSGKLSPISESYDGGVYIYATEALTETVSVGSVTCIKAVSA